MRDELDEAGLVWLERLAGGSDDFKVDCQRCFGAEGADLPS